MKVHGACHCGQVTYEAEVDPERVGICHCTDCQVLSGSAFRVSVPARDFRLLTGRTRVYLKTADSGNKRRHAFCPECGTPICATADEEAPSAPRWPRGGASGAARNSRGRCTCPTSRARHASDAPPAPSTRWRARQAIRAKRRGRIVSNFVQVAEKGGCCQGTHRWT